MYQSSKSVYQDSNSQILIDTKQFTSPPLFYKDSNSQIGISVNLPEAATLQCKALNQPLFSRDLQFRIGKFPNGYSNPELCNSILNKISFN